MATSRLSGTASSPASLGVRARRSAARSARVTSISWPTAETTGRREPAMARATISSLNAQRSSADPPPRATMIRSAPGHPVGQRDGGGDLGAGSRTLHAGGRDQDLGRRPAPAGHLEQVADGGPGRARDDEDSPGETGERPLSLRVEEALRAEPGVELAEGELLGADPFRLEMAHDRLVFSPGCVDRQSPEHPHRQAVGKIEGQPLRVALPHHGSQRRGAVAEAEIQVTRLGPGQVRDLAMNGDRVEVGLERPLDALRERGNRLEHRAERVQGRRSSQEIPPWARAVALRLEVASGSRS